MSDDVKALLRDRLPLPAPHSHHFRSGLRGPTVTARIGLWLGISFAVCFVTGLVSHFLQHPPFFFVWPTRPVGLYRWTQGLHVISGTAAIPLLGAKLWSVFPKLFAPFRLAPTRAALVTAVERGSILVLVGAAIFELLTGLFDTAQYYPWAFFFTTAHYAMAWVAIGALAVHVAIKLPIIRRALGVPVGAQLDVETLEVAEAEPQAPPRQGGLSRRSFLRATWVSAGVAVLATAGVTIPVLRHVSLLGTRTGAGPQALPVNKTAKGAGVVARASAPGWKLTVTGPTTSRSFTLDDLRAMEQSTRSLPIACVEGWSASATWTGVPVADLVAAVGGSPDADVRFSSLDPGLYGTSVLPARHARDRWTLLALQVNGQVLDLDHGYPARLIAPSRPGVTQTKWVTTMELL
ncbi:MAG: molybdopterin-dependent oxidoreductase [Mycobacteriaceae bacterium]